MLPRSGRVPDVVIMMGERCTGISVLYQIVTVCTTLYPQSYQLSITLPHVGVGGVGALKIHQFVRFALITLVAH